MDIVTTICVCFISFQMIHAKEWEPKIYAIGENATVHIGLLEIDRMALLEINFSGYAGKQHFTNVMLYDTRKNQSGSISINKKYIGRLERIEMNNVSLSFLLLKVNFMDSGNYTAFKDSMIQGKTSILVPRHRLLIQDGEPMILNFMFNITNATSIKIEMMISKLHFLVVRYDVTRANCTDIGDLYIDRIDSCALRDSNFSLTVKKVSFQDLGIYVAWNDMDFLTDSVFVEFEENITSIPERTHKYFSSTSISNLLIPDAGNCMLEWILVSAVVIVLMASGLIIYGVGRLRQRRSNSSESLESSNSIYNDKVIIFNH